MTKNMDQSKFKREEEKTLQTMGNYVLPEQTKVETFLKLSALCTPDAKAEAHPLPHPQFLYLMLRLSNDF